MSGGFFRGTSADQDTRFSNKQSKLLKSQKFPPELDHLVDTTKVKMDVIRPWIATRATELLGFEDEVLINFVYGLLEGKAVDGKKIQIQLTGFMEKNTSKFMKELWSLLLTAQVNVSGVPQQFLDAKEEEMKTKKAETDRIIALETQKRQEREERESEQRKQARMEGDANMSRSTNALPNSISNRSLPGDSNICSEEEREEGVTHGRRSKKRYLKSPHSSKSPHSNDHSPPPRWEGPKSRSVSVSPHSQIHSISPGRRYRSPRRRSISVSRRDRSPLRLSISPRRRYSPWGARSPPRKTSPRVSISPRRRHSPRSARSPRKSRQRSDSRPRYISPSRHRSPHGRRRSPLMRHRSPSPARRRSPSPLRRRSPVRRRSPSPYRRRSPIHRKSSPSRRRSPIRRRPLSPARRRSPSLVRRRSPLMSLKHRDSPLRSPINYASDLQISPRRRKRSRSPHRSQSPSYQTHRSLSTERDSRINSAESKHRDNSSSQRTREKRSPRHHALVREVAEHADTGRKVSDSVSVRQPISVRSPQRDSRDQADIRDKVSILAPVESPNRSDSPTHEQKINSRRNKSSSQSPVKQTRERMPHYDIPNTSREEGQTKLTREKTHHRSHSLNNRSKDLPAYKGIKNIRTTGSSPEMYSTDGSAENQSPSSRGHFTKLELRKRDREERRDRELTERHVHHLSPSSGVEYVAGKVKEERLSSDDVHNKQQATKQATKQQARTASRLEEKDNQEQALKHSHVDGRRACEERRSHSKSDEYIESHFEIESVSRSKTKVVRSKILNAIGSDTDETETHTEKHRHKKSDRHKKLLDDDSGSESAVDDRKMIKRRRKEEKLLRKEERRRKREERHRRKLERRASKLKTKSVDTVDPPSDVENSLGGSDRSDGQAAARKISHSSDAEEPESQQKKLEIELRKKALESLRAKKAISD